MRSARSHIILWSPVGRVLTYYTCSHVTVPSCLIILSHVPLLDSVHISLLTVTYDKQMQPYPASLFSKTSLSRALSLSRRSLGHSCLPRVGVSLCSSHSVTFRSYPSFSTCVIIDCCAHTTCLSIHFRVICLVPRHRVITRLCCLVFCSLLSLSFVSIVEPHVFKRSPYQSLETDIFPAPFSLIFSVCQPSQDDFSFASLRRTTRIDGDGPGPSYVQVGPAVCALTTPLFQFSLSLSYRTLTHTAQRRNSEVGVDGYEFVSYTKMLLDCMGCHITMQPSNILGSRGQRIVMAYALS